MKIEILKMLLKHMIFLYKNDNQIQTSLDVVGSAYTEKYQQRVMEAIENVKNKGNIQYHGRKIMMK